MKNLNMFPEPQSSNLRSRIEQTGNLIVPTGAEEPS